MEIPKKLSRLREDVGSCSPNGGVSVLREAYPADILPFGVYTTVEAHMVFHVFHSVLKNVSRRPTARTTTSGEREIPCEERSVFSRPLA